MVVVVLVVVIMAVAVAHPSSRHLGVEAEEQLLADPALVAFRLRRIDIQVSKTIEEDIESSLVHALPLVDDDQVSLLGL